MANPPHRPFSIYLLLTANQRLRFIKCSILEPWPEMLNTATCLMVAAQPKLDSLANPSARRSFKMLPAAEPNAWSRCNAEVGRYLC